jgi:CheY-like chemotaxis protein
MLEDDVDDRYITQTYFNELGYDIPLIFLDRPDDVLPYLNNLFEHKQQLPGLILLDKNVPARSGLEVLAELKSHPVFSRIPTVMVSGTALVADVEESYRLGANSFIVKPDSGVLTSQKIETFIRYWFGIVELPVITYN